MGWVPVVASFRCFVILEVLKEYQALWILEGSSEIAELLVDNIRVEEAKVMWFSRF